VPTYEYTTTDEGKACEVCRVVFEVRQSMRDEPLECCPRCGGPVRRLISRCAVNTRGEKSMLSDRNLKEKGFKKLVKQDDGSYRDVLG